MTVTDRRRDSLAPAFLAAAALHLAVFAIALYAPRPPIGPLGTAVPVTLVAHGPTTDSRPAEAAPVAQAAQTETPVPEAKPPAPPPAPPPRPAPPQPRAPPVKPVKPTLEPAPTPAKAQPKPPPPAKPARDTFNLDTLAADVARSRRASPPRPASGARGPARPETATEARVDAGQGVSQSDIAGLSQLLERLWNPGCDVEGAGTVVIPVRFTVSFDGQVLGRVEVVGHGGGGGVFATAARRAVDAVHQAAPYAATYRGQTFIINFDAKTACANR
jgi:outer membrane biosynthesis protein TonB